MTGSDILSFYVLKYPRIFNYLGSKTQSPLIIYKIIDFLDNYQNVKEPDDVYAFSDAVELVWVSEGVEILISFGVECMTFDILNNLGKDYYTYLYDEDILIRDRILRISHHIMENDEK